MLQKVWIEEEEPREPVRALKAEAVFCCFPHLHCFFELSQISQFEIFCEVKKERDIDDVPPPPVSGKASDKKAKSVTAKTPQMVLISESQVSESDRLSFNRAFHTSGFGLDEGQV